ncbi:hypothetical protein ES319_D08G065500v1, partial [Gossypium barbadense]
DAYIEENSIFFFWHIDQCYQIVAILIRIDACLVYLWMQKCPPRSFLDSLWCLVPGHGVPSCIIHPSSRNFLCLCNKPANSNFKVFIFYL